MQLLSEMDGFTDRGNVRIMAATNRIDMLDPAILRPGRFDRIIEIPLPDDKGREAIFKIHTRKMTMDADVDVPRILKEMTEVSGADIKSIVTEAGMFAIRRRSKSSARTTSTRRSRRSSTRKKSPLRRPTRCTRKIEKGL